MDDPYRLTRFVTAQNNWDMYENALEELKQGRKVDHWMWFVFPQIAGLGHSTASRTYAISSLEEAQAYLQHPVLGPRLRECAQTLLAVRHRTATQIFGSIDAIKLRSSMTLFAAANPTDGIYREILNKYFDGAPDNLTTDRLATLTGSVQEPT